MFHRLSVGYGKQSMVRCRLDTVVRESNIMLFCPV
nr:MAG TPA: hypothetical protein [Caudoviricetes sp.]